MKKSLILSLVMLFGISLLVSGCGKTVNEKLAENSLENALGGDANVDLNDGSVNIETDQGTWQVGENAELPADWPADVYVPAGKIITSSNTDFNQGVTIEVDKSVSEMEEEYATKIKDEGWDITMSLSMENNVMMGAEKGDKTLNITLSEEEGKTTMVIILADKL